jgi:hypothetical protein
MGVEPWCVATGALLKNESDDEKIAPAVARCRAPRKTGRGLNNVRPMRFGKRNGMFLCLKQTLLLEFGILMFEKAIYFL